MMHDTPAVSTTATGESEYTQSRLDAAKANGTANLTRLEIEPSMNDGFSVKAYYKAPKDMKNAPYMEPDVYAFSSFGELTTFLGEQFGPAEAEETPAA